MNTNMKNKKLLIPALIILVVVIAALVAYFGFFNKSTGDEKAITIEIIHGDGSVRTVEITTTAESLRGALEQESLVSGRDDVYGLLITTVDDETANEANEEWWCITKGGEPLMTGADSTTIADGEKYELTLTVGY